MGITITLILERRYRKGKTKINRDDQDIPQDRQDKEKTQKERFNVKKIRNENLFCSRKIQLDILYRVRPGGFPAETGLRRRTAPVKELP